MSTSFGELDLSDAKQSMRAHVLDDFPLAVYFAQRFNACFISLVWHAHEKRIEQYTASLSLCDRFIVGTILLWDIEKGAHANSFLLDLNEMTVEIFEPNGYSYIAHQNTYDDQEYRKALTHYFGKKFGRVRLIFVDEFCPRFSFQTIQHMRKKDGIEAVQQFDPVGFCQAWSVWWITYRLKNPNKTREELVRKAFTYFSDRNMTRFIRHYAKLQQSIVKTVKRLYGLDETMINADLDTPDLVKIQETWEKNADDILLWRFTNKQFRRQLLERCGHKLTEDEREFIHNFDRN